MPPLATAHIRASRGERLRLLALTLCAVAGAILCLASVDALDPSEEGSWGLGQIVWRLIAGASGGLVAVWLNLGRFGWSGPRGVMRMGGGVLLVTLFAPVIAGTLVLPLYGTMFGPLALWLTFLRRPGLAFVWFGCLLVLHRLLQSYRAERATIFI